MAPSLPSFTMVRDMMRILIIGARGFIGSKLVEACETEGAEVTCVTRGSLPPASKTAWLRLDQLSQSSWDDIISSRFDVVFHLGWSTVPRTAELDPLADLTDNLGSGLRLLTSIKNTAPKTRLIFASSGGAVYGRVGPLPVSERQAEEPISAYGIGKLNLERYLRLFRRQYGIDCGSARISNAYGPGPIGHQGFGAVTTFVRDALVGRPLQIFGSSEIVRDYIFITDVCAALSKLATVSSLPETVNVASGVGVSLSQIIFIIEEVLGRKIKVNIVAERSFDVQSIVLDISLLKDLLSWQPAVPLKEGVRHMITSALRM